MPYVIPTTCRTSPRPPLPRCWRGRICGCRRISASRRCWRSAGFERLHAGAAMSAPWACRFGMITVTPTSNGHSARWSRLRLRCWGWRYRLWRGAEVMTWSAASRKRARPRASRGPVLPKKCGHLNDKKLAAAEDMAPRSPPRARREASLLHRPHRAAASEASGRGDRARRYSMRGGAIFPEALHPREVRGIRPPHAGVLVLANMTEFGRTPSSPRPSSSRWATPW